MCGHLQVQVIKLVWPLSTIIPQNQAIISYVYICVYYVKSINMSRSLLFHVFIYVCTIEC